MVAAKRLGTIHNDAIPIAIRDVVLDAILDYASTDLQREIGGFLLGTYKRSPQPVLVIEQFVPAEHAESRHASLTITHESWARVTRRIDSEFPTLRIVGWQHTHPGFGIFLSAQDLFVHRNFFPEPWQVALVIDPQREELGFFQWRHGEVVDCGFLCFADEAPGSTGAIS